MQNLNSETHLSTCVSVYLEQNNYWVCSSTCFQVCFTCSTVLPTWVDSEKSHEIKKKINNAELCLRTPSLLVYPRNLTRLLTWGRHSQLHRCNRTSFKCATILEYQKGHFRNDFLAI